MKEERKIFFFDGDCAFCNMGVVYVMRNSVDPHVFFAPIQGETAKELGVHSEDPDSAVFYDGRKAHRNSAAMLRLGLAMGGGHALVSLILLFIPFFLRDWLYFAIVKVRRRLPAKQACTLATSQEKIFFLD